MLCVPAVLALLHPGFFLTDDGNWMVIRLSAFYEALRGGQFPVRFLLRLNHGYGYPVADFLYPLFLYIGVPIHLVGINFTTTVKIIIGASLISSALFTFFWLRHLVKESAAFIAGIVYLFFPYHIWDAYARGSVGEILSLALLPFTLWQIEKRNIFFTSISVALLILAHNSLAVLFLPFIIGYILIRKSFTLRNLGLVVGGGLFLSAFFWIPALYDKQFTIFDTTAISNIINYFLTFSSFQLIGPIGLVGFIVGLVLVVRKPSPIHLYFFSVTVVSLFLTLPVSTILWNVLHIGPFFQFPYRFLSLTIVGIAGLCAFFINSIQGKWNISAVFIFLIIAYGSCLSILFPKIYQYYPETFYTTNQDSTTVHNEYMPIWVKQQPTTYTLEKVRLLSGKGEIANTNAKGNSISFTTILSQQSQLQLNIVYFPGWKVFDNGKEIPISYTNQTGTIQFVLSAGVHMVKAQFSETPIRLLSDSISLVALLILFVCYKKLQRI